MEEKLSLKIRKKKLNTHAAYLRAAHLANIEWRQLYDQKGDFYLSNTQRAHFWSTFNFNQERLSLDPDYISEALCELSCHFDPLENEEQSKILLCLIQEQIGPSKWGILSLLFKLKQSILFLGKCMRVKATQKLAFYLFSETRKFYAGDDALRPEGLRLLFEEGLNMKSHYTIDFQCGCFLAEWTSHVLNATSNRDVVEAIIQSSVPFFCMIYEEKEQFIRLRSQLFSLIGSVFSVSQDHFSPLPSKFALLQTQIIMTFLKYLETDRNAAVSGLFALLFGKWTGRLLGERVVEIAKPIDLSNSLLEVKEFCERTFLVFEQLSLWNLASAEALETLVIDLVKMLEGPPTMDERFLEKRLLILSIWIKKQTSTTVGEMFDSGLLQLIKKEYFSHAYEVKTHQALLALWISIHSCSFSDQQRDLLFYDQKARQTSWVVSLMKIVNQQDYVSSETKLSNGELFFYLMEHLFTTNDSRGVSELIAEEEELYEGFEKLEGLEEAKREFLVELRKELQNKNTDIEGENRVIEI